MSLLVLFLMCFYNPLASVGDVYEDALRSGDVIFTGLTLPIHHNFKSGLLKKRFDFLNRKLIFSAEIRKSDSLTFQAYGLAHFDLGDNFGVVIEPLLKIGDSKEWPYVVWKKGITAHYSRAYLYYQNKGFFSYIGRNRISMNLGTLMADNDPPFDHFLVRYSGKNFQSFYFLGEFDQQTASDSSWFYVKGKTYRRFVVGHGVEFIYKRTTFGFNEVALFYNGSNTVNFYYVNPVSFYYPLKFDLGPFREREQNVFWILYLNHFAKKFSLHGELIIDDFQYESSDRYIPNKFAWSINFKLLDPIFPPSVLSVEYAGINRWTYNHHIVLTSWLNRREVMGKFSDNDMDSLEVRLKKYFGSFSFETFAGYKRKGPGSVFEADTFYHDYDYPRETFFNNPVSNKIFVGFNAGFCVSNFLISSLFSLNLEKDYLEKLFRKSFFISGGVTVYCGKFH